MKKFLLVVSLLCISLGLFAAEQKSGSAMITGEVISNESGEVLPFATVYLVQQNNHATTTDKNGRFKMRVPAGEHIVAISYMGYQEHREKISVKHKSEIHLKIKLGEQATTIENITIKGESASTKVNKLSYNVQSLSLDQIKNTSSTMTNALAKVNGIKIRESGGVGSDTKISLNGFSGNHVKIFIDGIQLDQTNSSFSLSNMPANFAERIDVYSGVVPIEFGADAIGGVINVVTNKNYRYESLKVDASYSYGSFNTHSSYIDVGQVFKNGLMYNVNFYQNYSDNDYWVTPEVYAYDQDGTMQYYGEQKVQRYNDAYHNETGIVTVGITGKSWADYLSYKANYSQYYNQIQTGTTEEIVYGDKYRKGDSWTHTAEYAKRNLIKGLELKASANYTTGFTKNYEPSGIQYDWFGGSKNNAAFTGVDSEMKNTGTTANVMAKYSFLSSHEVTLSHNYSVSNRTTRTMSDGYYSDWKIPQDNLKNITGLSYRFKPSKRLDITGFGKNYMQTNEGTYLSDDTYYWDSSTSSNLGYGAAASYFIIEGLQAKLSYEKSYRLPTSTEIFGDGDLEQGTFDLNPENSHNVNLNLIYGLDLGKHNIYIEGSLIYRDTRDYIQRSVASDASRGTTSASYENFGMVETKGYTATIRYNYSRLFNIGGTFNNISSRNAEGRLDSSGGSTLTYGLRLPNTPYMYANADASLNFFNIFSKGDGITVSYDMYYQYEFPLYWETIGYKDDKMYVPTQLAHNVAVNYSFMKGKYNLTVEAKNILNAELYDNYCLQKAGRAFYAKLRININQIKK